MTPILLAMSRASWSAVRRTYAFFLPSGRTSVLTLAALIWYIFLTAALICDFFERMSTMNTRVLWFSISCMAASVVRGCLITVNSVSTALLGWDLRRTLGLRARRRVCGRWNCTLVWIFFLALRLLPWA
eukprot:Amastigsp_a174501_11005.p3 type:complete len:129 gc:universal Amastigsp_a174501_11005:469-83(-)